MEFPTFVPYFPGFPLPYKYGQCLWGRQLQQELDILTVAASALSLHPSALQHPEIFEMPAPPVSLHSGHFPYHQ